MTFTKATILYRGSLKSCNYRCGYCPFSKRRGSRREYDRDREQWLRFVDSLAPAGDDGEKREAVFAGDCVEGGGEDRERPGPPRPVGAVMVTPYGEALIHDWYWQGLGRLASGDSLDCVGAQTNLSFSVRESMEEYRRSGGRTGKLRLWATFHPEMISAEEFAMQCRRVREEGASICAGAVGVPENLEAIRRLRRELPEDIYLWVNKMDGLKRPYTDREIQAFQEIDPWFSRELMMVRADASQCRERLFVEAEGSLRRCNISPVTEGNWYEGQIFQEPPVCGRKRCSCYLAYGGRGDVMNQVLFGPYPVFRIPRRDRAVFLDIQGTLIPDGEKEIPAFARQDLELISSRLAEAGNPAFRGNVKLFFATTLPLREARRRCRDVWHLFSGGVFAGGGHVVLEEGPGQERREMFYPLDRRWVESLRREALGLRARVHVYEEKGDVYKLTLWRPGHLSWKEEEINALRRIWGEEGEGQIRLFAEGGCLQMVSSSASKAQGVRTLCGWMGIPPEEAAAYGDSREDREMMEMCGSRGFREGDSVNNRLERSSAGYRS